MNFEKLTAAFVEDVRESMRELEIHLCVLEEQTESKESLDQIARLLHSVKGASGFMEFQRMEAVCASCEVLLTAVYDGLVPVDGQVVQILRMAASDVHALAEAIDRDGRESASKYEHIIRRIHALTGASNH